MEYKETIFDELPNDELFETQQLAQAGYAVNFGSVTESPEAVRELELVS